MNHCLIIGNLRLNIKYLRSTLIILLRGTHFAFVKWAEGHPHLSRLEVLFVLVKLLKSFLSSVMQYSIAVKQVDGTIVPLHTHFGYRQH